MLNMRMITAQNDSSNMFMFCVPSIYIPCSGNSMFLCSAREELRHCLSFSLPSAQPSRRWKLNYGTSLKKIEKSLESW